MAKLPRLVVMASGEGTNFAALADAAQRGDLRAEITELITDNHRAGVIDKAKDRLTPITYVDWPNDELAMFQHLIESSPDLIVLAGFNRILPAHLVRRPKFVDRIINTHSAPLPEYGGKGMYGRRLREAVLQDGLSETAITVHLVQEEVDAGHVIAVQPVPIMAGDTVDSLDLRIKTVENDFYWRVIDRYLEELGLV